MKILLTGGAGFIGSHLAERLLESGQQLVLLDNLNNYYDPRIKEANLARVREKGEFAFWRQDLLDRDVLVRLFREETPEVVIHLAAYAGVRPSLQNPGLYCDVNVRGTAELLEGCRQGGVRHFVFGSSSSVYGVNSRVPFHEEDPVNQPVSPYAVSKRAGELLGYSHHHNYGLEVTCLRFFTVYGPRQRPDMAVHKFTRMIEQGLPIAVYHQGRSQRDYTFIDDIVSGIVAALERPRGFQIYNLGNAHLVPLGRLIEVIETALGKPARREYQGAQTGDVPITLADIAKAQRELGYHPTTDIVEGVGRFVRWYREQRASGNLKD